MGQIEEIYTVHVKSKQGRDQIFPSERVYSSTTVGGLAITHLIVAVLSATFTAAYSSQGVIIASSSLIIGCVSCGITGLLASKKWYIEYFIKWFFGACLASIFTSSFSFGATITWIYRFENCIVNEIHLHILLASILELILSLFSLKISWKGVRNYENENPEIPIRTEGDGGSKPDIVLASNYTDVVRELYRLQKKSGMCNDEKISKIYEVSKTGLPLPESNKEYKERIDKFLSSEPDKQLSL